MNAITCMSWVKRGVSKREPDRIKLDEDEIEKLVSGPKNAGKDDSDSEAADDGSDDVDSGDDSIDKKYKLDDYDDDEDDSNDDDDEDDDSDDNSDENDDSDKGSESDIASDIEEKLAAMQKSKSSSSSGLVMAGLSFYGSNKQDPYMKGEESSDDEAEIMPDDNLLAIGKVNGDLFGLEVYVYNEASSSLYCHHDTIMGSFPLAMEWVGYDPGESAAGNLLAVGSMDPHIELWDLDVVDTLEPAFVLEGTHKKKGKKRMKTSGKGHSDAVLDLAWNSLQQQVLASGSADCSIGLWDLDQGKMVTNITHHDEKIQALKWHPFEHQTLLSGSFDKTVKVYDCRSSNNAHKSWTAPGEVERVAWNTHDPFYFLASTDCGHVCCFDVRTTKPVFTTKAHNAAVSGLALSSELPGCLVTSSSDKLVKVWDIRQNKMEIVFEKNYSIGDVLCLSQCPDSGYVFGVGGERELKVIHLKTAAGVVERFESEAASTISPAAKKGKSKKFEESESDSSSESESDTKVTNIPQKKKKLKKSSTEEKHQLTPKSKKRMKDKNMKHLESESDSNPESETDISKIPPKKKKLNQSANSGLSGKSEINSVQSKKKKKKPKKNGKLEKSSGSGQSFVGDKIQSQSSQEIKKKKKKKLKKKSDLQN